MIQAVSSEIAIRERKMEQGKYSGTTQCRTNFIGKLDCKQLEDQPQTRLMQYAPHISVAPHYHHVDQFQIFVEGSGSLGRNPVPPVTLHYTDHHTAYGPIVAGPLGLSNFTIRAQTDPGGVYLDMPGYKDFLKPSKQRHLLKTIGLSTGAVMETRSEALLENVLADADCSDGLGAFVLRLGAGMKTTGPDTKTTGGQYYLVINGSLQYQGTSYPALSTIYVDPTDDPLEVGAGPRGVEVLVLNFPRAKEPAGINDVLLDRLQRTQLFDNRKN